MYILKGLKRKTDKISCTYDLHTKIILTNFLFYKNK